MTHAQGPERGDRQAVDKCSVATRDKDAGERSAWGWLPLTVQALAAVGALAYSTIHVSFQNFYDSLGVTPESVGATSTTILAQSSLRVIEFGLLFAFIPVLLVLLAFLALDRWTPRHAPRWIARGVARRPASVRGLASLRRPPATESRPPLNTDNERKQELRRRTLRRWTLALIAIVPFPLYQRLTHGRTYSSIVVFSFVALLVLSLLLREVQTLRLRHVRHGSAAVVVVLWIGLTVCWIVLTSLSNDATAAGLCVQNGVPVRYVHTHRHLPFLARIPVLRVEAEPVDGSDADKLGATPGAKLLYLGQSSGTAVVWDASDRRTLLLPSSTIIRLAPVRAALRPGPACTAYVS
jgi:hypothetical protein